MMRVPPLTVPSVTVAVLVAVCALPTTTAGELPLQVGVFSGHGVSAGSFRNAIEALRIDPDIVARAISADDILGGALEELDAIVFPGGSGSRQVNNLGELGTDLVRRFVLEDGRGAVGICAGAYLLTDTPDYLCLRLCGVEAVDREHDERGHGIIAFSITEQGLTVFPELAGSDTHLLYYYEGPLLVPAAGSRSFQVLGRFLSDVHLENDAPAGIMPGKPMLVRAEAGQGRVFLSACHPEATPGMRWMLPRMVRWTCRREAIPYTGAVVRPMATRPEGWPGGAEEATGLRGGRSVILFDQALLQEEEELLQQVLYTPPGDRITAIRRLVDIRSWSGAQLIAGCLRSADPEVRLTAAVALAELEATWATPAVERARDLAPAGPTRASLEIAAARLAAMTPAVPQPHLADAVRQVAVTFDDLPVVAAAGKPEQSWPEVIRDLIAAITGAGVPVVGFVTGSRLADEQGTVVPWRADLLRSWSAAGLELANHTFSHPDLHRMTASHYVEEIRKGDEILRPIVTETGGQLRYFRHPYLHTGRDDASKQAVDAFLATHGYRVAPVTIDSSEWIFASAYADALQRSDASTAARIAAAYLPYLEAKVDYFERQSRALFGREIRQILLLHANALNADTLEEVLAMLQRRGYTFVTLEQALADVAYSLDDGYFGGAGISWLHRWCLAHGGRHLLVPDEPRCPHWVMDLAGVDSE